jgi:hypothetical protein
MGIAMDMLVLIKTKTMNLINSQISTNAQQILNTKIGIVMVKEHAHNLAGVKAKPDDSFIYQYHHNTSIKIKNTRYFILNYSLIINFICFYNIQYLCLKLYERNIF